MSHDPQAREIPAKSLYALTDEEVSLRCLENKRDAWNEFFRRFIPTLRAGIREVLSENGRYDLLGDEDILCDINEKIVDELLEYCESKNIPFEVIEEKI